MPKLESRTAIVTGGASGIGLAIAHLFAREGAFVEILDRNREEMSRAGAPAGGTNSDGFKDLTIRGLEALVVEAFRELNNKIEALERKHATS